MTKKSTSQQWYNTLKENPEEIIEWARSEIKEYKKLIKIIEKENK